MKNYLYFATACFLLVGLSFPLKADEPKSIQYLQTRWAEINYQLPEAEREKAFADLVKEAESSGRAHSQDAAYLIWEGIIRSTYAGAKGGLGALGEAKAARKLFERAIELQPGALAGSAHTSLGSLYYQVPSWPIGFGNPEKAEALLLQGLSYNPEGIDSHYFYGDFLLEQKQYQQAITHFETALNAPPRPQRASADAGRKEEIQLSLKLAREKLAEK